MANKLAPFPVGINPGSSYWTDLYERVRYLVNILVDASTSFQLKVEKDGVSGYAGLNASSRVTKGTDTADDLIVDNNAKGLVLKSPNGHYWRATVTNVGTFLLTDLGTTKP